MTMFPLCISEGFCFAFHLQKAPIRIWIYKRNQGSGAENGRGHQIVQLIALRNRSSVQHSLVPEYALWNQTASVQNLPPPLTSCVTLRELLNPRVSSVPICKTVVTPGAVEGLNEGPLVLLLQADLGDTVGSVPDHRSKAHMSIK